MAKSIMIQGTASSVGKSIITAGLCRIFKNDGYRVAPFKSQNMALNSYITKDGHEMGRAQVVQAEASGIPPDVLMNPILLKPTSDRKSQVIINGKVFKNMDAKDYYDYKPKLIDIVASAYEQLASEKDIVVIEGAGSPAEINLRKNDIVNMGMAEIADTNVLLVADIDRGGVFASILGTVMLLTSTERERVKGIIINKFRGDVEILRPGLDEIFKMTEIPVIGVIPYFNLKIDDEDSLCEKFSSKDSQASFDIDIVVIKLPYISNFTDFNALENARGVRLRYCSDVKTMGRPDMIIIPGSKNTVNDLLFLREQGFDNEIMHLNRSGVYVFGICAGMQILGELIKDPDAVESEILEVKGLGLLNIETVFEKEKITAQINAFVKRDSSLFSSFEELEKIEGYEIHMGETYFGADTKTFITRDDLKVIGASNKEGTVYGTYLHGIFDNSTFCELLLKNIAIAKGKKVTQFVLDNYEFKETQYEELARVLRENLDIDFIYSTLKNRNE